MGKVVQLVEEEFARGGSNRLYVTPASRVWIYAPEYPTVANCRTQSIAHIVAANVLEMPSIPPQDAELNSPIRMGLLSACAALTPSICHCPRLTTV